jgi:hypothetical protein
MLHTQSNPVLHGNLVALDLELYPPSHVLNRQEAGKIAGKASRRAFGPASVLCRARDYSLTLGFSFAAIVFSFRSNSTSISELRGD